MAGVRAGLAYDWHGRGDARVAVVALHGVGHDRAAWRTVVPHLDPAIALVAVDLPGHGDSALPTGGGSWDVSRLTRSVTAFLAEAQLERPIVVGNSLGGAIALELADRGRARAAIALAPTGYWSAAQVRYAVTLLRASQAVARMVGDTMARHQTSTVVRTVTLAPYSARPWRVDPAVAADAVRAFGHADALRPILARSPHYRGVRSAGLAGSTVAWGDRDRLLVGRQARRCSRALPNARHVALRGSGHVPMFDAPEAVADLIGQTALTVTGDEPGDGAA